MVRVGEELAFLVNGVYGPHWIIRKVERITKCGLVRCGRYLLTMDLEVRSKRSVGLLVERVTDEIRAEAEAYQQRVRAIERLRKLNFARLTNEQLRAVMEIVNY